MSVPNSLSLSLNNKPCHRHPLFCLAAPSSGSISFQRLTYLSRRASRPPRLAQLLLPPGPYLCSVFYFSYIHSFLLRLRVGNLPAPDAVSALAPDADLPALTSVLLRNTLVALLFLVFIYSDSTCSLVKDPLIPSLSLPVALSRLQTFFLVGRRVRLSLHPLPPSSLPPSLP